MKKTISLFLSLVMLLSITAGINFNAYASENITGVDFTIPDSFAPVAGVKANAHDFSGITASATGTFTGTYSVNTTACIYQVKNGSYWENVNSTDEFQVGKEYRIAVSGKAEYQNVYKHDENLVCKINGVSLPKEESENIYATSDYFYINSIKTIVFAYHYYGMLTQEINSITITGAPDFEYGQDITINPYVYKTTDPITFTNIAIEVKDGSTWKAATKYECNTKYRFVFSATANDGYSFKNNFTATVKTAKTNKYSNKSEVKDAGKTGTFYCEFPNVPVAHTFGTSGDARFTCTVCNKVDAEKKAEVVAEDAFAASKDAISALPAADKVTLSDKTKIAAARKAFDALTDEQKEKFSAIEYKKLVDAEAALAALEKANTPAKKVTYSLKFAKISKIKRSAKSVKIKVTLKKNGKVLKNKKVTLKIAGKTLTAKTNKKGVATFTVKKAVLKKLKAGKKTKLVAKYGKNVSVTKKVKVVK